MAERYTEATWRECYFRVIDSIMELGQKQSPHGQSIVRFESLHQTLQTAETTALHRERQLEKQIHEQNETIRGLRKRKVPSSIKIQP